MVPSPTQGRHSVLQWPLPELQTPVHEHHLGGSQEAFQSHLRRGQDFRLLDPERVLDQLAVQPAEKAC